MRHGTLMAYRVLERDVAEWLQLLQPGVLYQVWPELKVGPRIKLQCHPADDNIPGHYLVPLEGSDFEATFPREDVHQNLASCPFTSECETAEMGDYGKGNLGGPSILPAFFRRHADTGSKERMPTGQEYSACSASFSCDNSTRRSPFYRDEAYDFLDSGLLPHRVVHRRDRTQAKISTDLAAFARMARESFMVSNEKDSRGRRTLFHIMRPSRGHEHTGTRDTKYGRRIVPPEADIDDIVAWEHEKTHSGDRAIQRIIHGTYDIDSVLVRQKLHAFKRACDMCTRNLKLPKSTPSDHIVSDHFGERILVDCKTVYGKGYIVVVVDHLTTLTWTTFVKNKNAKPIAAFVGSVIKEHR